VLCDLHLIREADPEAALWWQEALRLPASCTPGVASLSNLPGLRPFGRWGGGKWAQVSRRSGVLHAQG
jgi:hypothetical protein